VEQDFESGGGVFFVRTLDGRHARIEFYPDAFEIRTGHSARPGAA